MNFVNDGSFSADQQSSSTSKCYPFDVNPEDPFDVNRECPFDAIPESPIDHVNPEYVLGGSKSVSKGNSKGNNQFKSVRVTL